MGIKAARFFSILCLAWTIYWPLNYMVIGYCLFMWTSVEILSSKVSYQELPYHKLYNGLFIGLVIFTTIDRSRRFVIPAKFEWAVNAVEHFLFTMVVCLMICVYAVLFYRRKLNLLLLISFAVMLFNIIGVGNEFYQNLFKIKHVGLFFISEDSWIDILVNIISSFICIGWVYFFPKYFPKTNASIK